MIRHTGYARPQDPAPLAASRLVLGLWLAKLGKYLAAMACVLIAGQAAGRVPASELALFALVIVAAIAHASGRICISHALARQRL
jgi:hypothetical protein